MWGANSLRLINEDVVILENIWLIGFSQPALFKCNQVIFLLCTYYIDRLSDCSSNPINASLPQSDNPLRRRLPLPDRGWVAWVTPRLPFRPFGYPFAVLRLCVGPLRCLLLKYKPLFSFMAPPAVAGLMFGCSRWRREILGVERWGAGPQLL